MAGSHLAGKPMLFDRLRTELYMPNELSPVLDVP